MPASGTHSEDDSQQGSQNSHRRTPIQTDPKSNGERAGRRAGAAAQSISSFPSKFEAFILKRGREGVQSRLSRFGERSANETLKGTLTPGGKDSPPTLRTTRLRRWGNAGSKGFSAHCSRQPPLPEKHQIHVDKPEPRCPPGHTEIARSFRCLDRDRPPEGESH